MTGLTSVTAVGSGDGVGLAVAGTGSPSVGSGPISYWPADGNAQDIVSHHDGALQGAASYVPGVAGQAFNFSADGDNMVIGNSDTAGTPTDLQLDTTFTVGGWVRRADASQIAVDESRGPGAPIFAAGGSGAYALLIFDDGRVVLNQLGGSYVITSPLLVADTSWHYVAVTKSGPSVTFYVDGVAESAPAYDPGFVFDSGYAPSIGGTSYEPGNVLNGNIDEVKVWGRALTGSEIVDLFHATASNAPHFPVPGITTIGENTAVAGTSISLTITGTGFVTASQVDWTTGTGTTVLTPSWVATDGTQLTVTIPATQPAATTIITVHTPPFLTTGTDGGTSNGVLFYLTQTNVTIANAGTSTSSTGSATATTGTGLTASTSGTGSASVTVAQYSTNPTSTDPPATTSAYFDVYVPGTTTTGVTITDCNVTGNTLYWWDGTQWSPVSNQTYDSPSAGCITATLSSTSSPTTLQLTGTPFGVVTIPASIVQSVTGPPAPTALGAPVSAAATFTDVAHAAAGPFTVSFDWGDGSATTTTAASPPTASVAGSASAMHTYVHDGVYTLTATVKDRYGQISSADQYQYIVVYDSSAGFTTGGGWINSAAGSYIPNPSLAGRAEFGFVSKYQHGATVPSGSTQFDLSPANLHFKSTSYQWMVIAGAKAQYKGSGTLGGSGDAYGFLLTAVDGHLAGSGGADTFRMKIWDVTTGGNVIYDDQVGTGADTSDTAMPVTPLGGGSIHIHN